MLADVLGYQIGMESAVIPETDMKNEVGLLIPPASAVFLPRAIGGDE